VSTGLKKKHSKFTFQSLIRLIVFIFIVFFIISYVSNQKLNSSVNISVDPTLYLDEKQSNYILGKTTEIGNNIYQSIPKKSREQLENLNEIPALLYIQEKIDIVKEQSQGFPQKQIKEIQKMILTNFYENSMRNIESN